MHTKNFYMQTIEGVDDAFGFGDTEQSYAERQKMSDYSKVKGYAFALGKDKWDTFGWWENRTVIDRENHQDKVVHEFLEKIPGITKKDEVFRFDKSFGLTLDIIKDKIHREFFSDRKEEKPKLALRPHQQEFVVKASADYEEFLLFAKCRAGKSVMALSHIVDKGFKVSLVVSRYTSPMQSWKDDSKNFGNFNDLVFIDVNDKDYVNQVAYWYPTDKQIILWACVQSRKILSLPVDVDLLVYDEAHVGYNSNQWNKLREVTDCPVLYVTGTAYKMVWDFADSQRYIYSYFEEQREKKLGMNNRPSMNVVLAKFDSSGYQALFGDDPDAMNNTFRVDDEGNFLEEALVKEFISKFFSNQRELRSSDRLLKDATHLYLTLPSVAACHAFAKYLKGTRFAPLVVTGETGNDAEDINKHIEENPMGSAILTRSANVLGVTAASVDTIVNCAEGSSIEFWTQFAFRGGSSDHDWTVIDFVPERCLESLRQTFVASCDTSPEVAEYDLLDYVCVSEWSSGFTTLSQEQVNEILAADVGNAIRLVSGLASSLNFDNLRDIDFNLDIEPVGSVIAKKFVLNSNNANGKTNKKLTSEVSKSEVDEIYKKIATIQAILERVPLVLYHAANAGETMNNIDSVLESPHYEPVTLDEERILKMALEYNVIDRKSLSFRISKAYIDVQNAIHNDKRETLAKLSESAQPQQDIPLELLDQMLCIS